MTTFLDTIESYEDQLLELVKKSQQPIVEYVTKGVELVDGRLPELTYPKALPTPIEVVQSQVRFTKKLIDANAAVVTAVLETVAPVAGYAKPKKATKATPAAKAA
ncbi:MAG: hypothetical protein ACLGI8_06265 [Acidimicrobiia bacterium]|jgi:hypothetical protein